MRLLQRIELSERERWMLLNAITGRIEQLKNDAAMFEKYGHGGLVETVSIEIAALGELDERIQDAAVICLETD